MAEDQINLRTLMRVDPNITDIVVSATQVAVYKFNCNDWERKEIEGSLFVFQRRLNQFKYGFIVMNRLSTNNMIETISGQLDLVIELPYILYKNDANQIYCIWFYNKDECNEVGQTIQRLVAMGPNAANESTTMTVQQKLAFLAGSINHQSSPSKGETKTVFPIFETPKMTVQMQMNDIDGNDHIMNLLSRGQRNSRTTSQVDKEDKQEDKESSAVVPMSMEQLKQTLVYLLQNDADFLHCIHKAYSNGIQSRK